MTTSTEKKSRFDGSPTYCLSSSSDISSSSSSISSINQRVDQNAPYRAFHKIPEQILRYILTFLNARELSRRCVYVCKRFSVESKRAAKTILDVLADRYRWIKLLLVDRNQQTADENRYTSEKRTILDNNKEKNMIPKKQNITTSSAMTVKNMKRSGDYERIQLQNILKNNLKNNIYVLHTLTSPSIISVGGNFEPKRVDSYDVIHNKWIELSQTNIGREVFFEVLWYSGFIYVFCGIHHSSYGSVERLNPLTNIWTKVTSLPGENNVFFLFSKFVSFSFLIKLNIFLHFLSYCDV